MNETGPQLRREVGVFGATMMGLGSILGTGIFVSVGIATGAAGPSVVLAIFVAALVATCNALSSAQLAANHAVSGGTYEYGYRWLSPQLGFTAGWLFLCAKSASAATAALGSAGYLFNAAALDAPRGATLVAAVVVAAVTALVLSGLRRANSINIAIVTVTILSLVAFVVAGLPRLFSGGTAALSPFFAPVDAGTSPLAGFFEASALMFVAYTGYGRSPRSARRFTTRAATSRRRSSPRCWSPCCSTLASVWWRSALSVLRPSPKRPMGKPRRWSGCRASLHGPRSEGWWPWERSRRCWACC